MEHGPCKKSPSSSSEIGSRTSYPCYPSREVRLSTHPFLLNFPRYFPSDCGGRDQATRIYTHIHAELPLEYRVGARLVVGSRFAAVNYRGEENSGGRLWSDLEGGHELTALRVKRWGEARNYGESERNAGEKEEERKREGRSGEG